MKNIQISIITPVFNREDCIVRCMDSVVNQFFNSYELIVIDDGSTDGTKEILREYAAKYTSIKPVFHEINKGTNAARNSGIKIAQGEYILFLDSDDYLLSDSLIKVSEDILNYQDCKHFLFQADHRLSDYNNNPILNNTPAKIFYSQWLSEQISGDFVHVIHQSIAKYFPFDEYFRIYESLNFLKMYKNEPYQLYIPTCIIHVELGRSDSVTKQASLYFRGAIEKEFLFLYLLITDNKDSMLDKILYTKIKRACILGCAVNQISKCQELVHMLPQRFFFLHFFILFARFTPLKFILRSVSYFKHKIKVCFISKRCNMFFKEISILYVL